MISRPLRAILGAATAIGVAVAFRIPSFLSTRHLGYDDGLYASSVILMRAGFDPFRDFFSSQGPLFLPFLRAFDMIGIGGLRASRSAIVFTGAALAVAIYFLVALDYGRYRAAAAALIGASSGRADVRLSLLERPLPIPGGGSAPTRLRSRPRRW